MHLETLRAAVERFDELSNSMQQLSPRMSWPAKRWMISSTSFRMRLTTARKLLNDLSGIRLDGDHNAVCWALELNDVRLEVERRLRDVEACLYMLQHVDTLPAQRARATE